MPQLRLEFDAPPRPALPPAVRVRTSIAAAEAIADTAPTLRGKVFAYIGQQGEAGATREEISVGLGMKIQTVCGRCNELLRLGLVFDCGKTRATSSGKQAVVLRQRK